MIVLLSGSVFFSFVSWGVGGEWHDASCPPQIPHISVLAKTSSYCSSLISRALYSDFLSLLLACLLINLAFGQERGGRGEGRGEGWMVGMRLLLRCLGCNGAGRQWSKGFWGDEGEEEDEGVEGW